MLQAVLQFVAKAAPRFVGAMMRPGRKAQAYYRLMAGKFAKTKHYEKIRDFLGEKPGQFFKECARDAVKQTTTNLMFGAMMGAANKIMSGGTKMLSFPRRITGSVGGNKVPGIQGIQAAQTTAVKSFNSVSRVMNMDKQSLQAQRSKQKKIIDRYKKSFQRKNFSMGEIATLGQKLEVDLQKQKGKLTKALKDGDKTLVGMSQIRQPQKIAVPNVPADQKALADYTKQAFDQTNQQMVDNIKAVNENLKRSLVTMQKKQEDISQRMMSNLGNYNSVAMSKLADTVTKAEETSFKKQQESAFYQTEMLADKMDASHDYTTKQGEVLRTEVAANRQTMYDLNKQDRMIDDQYRALEEKRNKGVTLATLAAMVQSTAGMVQQGLKTPDVIKENVDNAMQQVAKTAGEEVGRLIMLFKTLLDGWRTILYKVYDVLPFPINNTVRPIIGLLDWVNHRIFKGLLGADDSAVADYFGTPMDFNKMIGAKNDYMEEGEGGRSLEEVKGRLKYVVGHQGAVRSSSADRDAVNQATIKYDIHDRNFKHKGGGNYQVMTISGKTFEVKGEKLAGESDDQFMDRMQAIATEMELSEPIDLKDIDASRENTKEAVDKTYLDAIDLIENCYVERGSKDTFITTYKLHGFVSATMGNNCGPETEFFEITGENLSINNKEIVTPEKPMGKDNRYFKNFWQPAWLGKGTKLGVNGELKIRLSKLFKQARERGIKYYVSSVMRIPNNKFGYMSAHTIGFAVDVSIDCGSMGKMSSVIAKFFPQGVAAEKITWDELQFIVKEGDKVLEDKPGKEMAYMYFKQWFDFLTLCNAQGLSFGSTGTSLVKSYRKELEGQNVVLDLVHITLSNERNRMQEHEATNIKKLGGETIDADLADLWHDNQSKTQQAILQHDLQKSREARKAFISDILSTNNITTGREKIQTPDGGEVTSPIDSHYYTDTSGKKYNVKDYMMNEKGEIVKRDKQNTMLTDTGNIIADIIRQGKLTPEMKSAIEEYYQKHGEKGGNRQEAQDLATIINQPSFVVNNNMVNQPSSSYSDMGSPNSEQQ